ncbi:hypothetical protein QQ045_002882 [Rhodiola kirilowii]
MPKWADKSKMHRVKEEGGLGWRNFQLVNTALLIKQAWRIHSNPELLLSKVYKARYFQSSSLLEAQLGTRPSWGLEEHPCQVLRKWLSGNEGVDILVAAAQTIKAVKEFNRVDYKFVISCPESRDQWEPPEEGKYKISCDGAWDSTTKAAGIGVVCRNSTGGVEFVAAKSLEDQSSITEVEGMALQLGMKLAKEMKVSKATFVSDNTEVIQALLSHPMSQAKEGSWRIDCIRMLESFHQWNLEHVMLEANMVVDLLTHKAREERWSWESSHSIPIFLSYVVNKDESLAGLDC